MNETVVGKEKLPVWLVVCLIVTLVVAVVGGLAYWAEIRARTVVSEEPVGEVTDARFAPSNIGVSSTTVKTTKGYFLVYGIFQSHKGSDLVLETLANDDVVLCDRENSVCK